MGNNLARQKYWIGKLPTNDSFGDRIFDEFYDGRTNLGPWAIMTPHSFETWGMGLGQGSGQKYVRQADGRFLKVEG